MIHDKIPLTEWEVRKASDFVEWLQIKTENGNLSLITCTAPNLRRPTKD